MAEEQVIHGARGKMVVLIFAAGLFTIGNFAVRDALIADGGIRALVGYFGPLFWLACGGVGVFRAIYPPILTIGADGFSVDERLGSPKTVAWSEVEGFHLRKVSGLASFVAYDFHQPERIAGAFPVGGRAPGYLNDHWTVSVKDLAALMQSRLEASRK